MWHELVTHSPDSVIPLGPQDFLEIPPNFPNRKTCILVHILKSLKALRPSWYLEGDGFLTLK